MRMFRPFDFLNIEESKVVMRYLEEIHFAKGSYIIKQGMPAVGLYILKSGSASAKVTLPGQRVISLLNIKQGEYIGEISLIDKEICSASVIAEQPTDCYFIKLSHFDILESMFPDIAYKIKETIAKRACERIRQVQQYISKQLKYISKLKRSRITAEKELGSRRPRLRDFLYVKMLDHFKPLMDDHYKILIKNTKSIEVKKGDVIFKQYRCEGSCFLVLIGAIEVDFVLHRKSLKLKVCAPGNIFGNISFIDHQPRATTCVAREDALLLEISHQSLNKIRKLDILLWKRIYDFINFDLLQLLRYSDKQIIRLDVVK